MKSQKEISSRAVDTVIQVKRREGYQTPLEFERNFYRNAA